MSLIKKSDVKNHLSTRSGATFVDEATEGSTSAQTADVTESPLHLIGAEPVANAQVGGAVGVPASAPWQPRKL